MDKKTILWVIGVVLVLVGLFFIVNSIGGISVEKECGTIHIDGEPVFIDCEEGFECIPIDNIFNDDYWECLPEGETKFWKARNNQCEEITLDEAEGRIFSSEEDCLHCLNNLDYSGSCE